MTYYSTIIINSLTPLFFVNTVYKLHLYFCSFSDNNIFYSTNSLAYITINN